MSALGFMVFSEAYTVIYMLMLNERGGYKMLQEERLKEGFTKEELSKVMTDLLHDICENSGESFVRIDGYEYHTDMGYAIEGIEFFIFLLKKRLEKMKEADKEH